MLIEDRTDLKVDRQLSLGRTIIYFSALENGDFGVNAEYTGTELSSFSTSRSLKTMQTPSIASSVNGLNESMR